MYDFSVMLLVACSFIPNGGMVSVQNVAYPWGAPYDEGHGNDDWLEPLASQSVEDVAEFVAPVLQRYMVGRL